jgi:hypothetical protein
MARYRKRPVVIEATQWFENGDHPQDEIELIDVRSAGYEHWTERIATEGKIVRYYRTPQLRGQVTCTHCGRIFHEHGWIDTLEGGHIVCPGDWIITGVKGEYYPCKPDIFEVTYEPAVEEQEADLGPFASMSDADLVTALMTLGELANLGPEAIAGDDLSTRQYEVMEQVRQAYLREREGGSDDVSRC